MSECLEINVFKKYFGFQKQLLYSAIYVMYIQLFMIWLS